MAKLSAKFRPISAEPVDSDELMRAADALRGVNISSGEPQPVDVAFVRYSAALGTTNVPSAKYDGIELPWGRVYAEPNNITVAAGSPVLTVTLVSSQNGVRALCNLSSSTIAGGTIRWWTQDPQTLVWYLSPVEDTLPTGVQNAATPDQFTTVGAK